jgi:hypothetical protein
MTFASAPADVSATQISMTATTASDPSTPVQYLFTFTACGSNGGTGGASSSWQSSTFYSNSGLQPNKCYGYTVQARDSLLNTGTASSVSSTYTSAAVPGTPTLTGATTTTLNLTNAENGNPSASPTTYFAVQVVTTSPNDATWLNQWVSVLGNPSATEVWLTDAELDALVLQGLTSSTTYGVRVKARNQDGDQTALSAEGQGTTLSPANLDQIHTRWRNDDGPEVNIRVNSGHTVYTSAGSVTDHVINTPPHSVGDVIYIAFAVDQVQTITWPAGFTGGQDDFVTTATWGMAYKVAGASEPSTYTVSVGIAERAVAIAWSTSNDGGIDANSTPMAAVVSLRRATPRRRPWQTIWFSGLSPLTETRCRFQTSLTTRCWISCST